MFISNFISFDNVLINPEVTTTHFACDLSKCKGACCTLESDFGAPLELKEIEILEDILPIVKEYLPLEHKEEIEFNGFYERKFGEYLTRSVNRRACVFVYYENGIAKCGIEKVFIEGKTNFRKPISCHLFPIRISKFGGDILRYEKFSDCKPALENGKKLNITILDFCRNALQRLYGNNWFNKLKETIGK